MKHEVNTILHTLDGSKIGNAIITRVNSESYTVKTDYGNVCDFTEDELKEYFKVGNSFVQEFSYTHKYYKKN